MENAHKINRLLKFISLSILVATWLYVFGSYSSLPEIIPIHFNGTGTPDNYGSKKTIFLLPLITTVIYTGLQLLTRIPNAYNYPVKITDENREQPQQLAIRLLQLICFVIVVLFAYISFKTIHDSTSAGSILDWWFIPLLMISLILPTGWYLVKSFSANKK